MFAAVTNLRNQTRIEMFRFAVVILIALAVSINGHGRFMKPPNRSSLWRVSEFNDQLPPVNVEDNQLFCGGLHQAEVVGGNCGVCGDPISESTPRANEVDGEWYRGIIAATYNAGQVIDVEVEITASYAGYMEWRLCDNIDESSSQSCYKYLLQRADGQGSKVAIKQYGWYRTQLILPAGVRCDQCVIQWSYRAGNSWGECDDGSMGSECGPQETYRGCSDVRIN